MQVSNTSSIDRQIEMQTAQNMADTENQAIAAQKKLDAEQQQNQG